MFVGCKSLHKYKNEKILIISNKFVINCCEDKNFTYNEKCLEEDSMSHNNRHTHQQEKKVSYEFTQL